MTPDLILNNGTIYTGDLTQTAPSLSVAFGRIIALAELPAGPKTEVIDLKGQAVLPGFNDAHTHFCNYGLNLVRVNLEGLTSIEAAARTVGEYAARKKPGEWVRGFGWNQNLWDRWPVRQDLDRVSPHNPVALVRKDYHLLWVNSAALDRVGWTAATPDPPGGKIDRDAATGELTGVLREKAMSHFLARAPKPSAEECTEAIDRATGRFHRFGITSLHTMDIDHTGEFQILQHLNQQRRLRLRFHSMIHRRDLENSVSIGLRTGFGNEFLSVGPVKLFLDGTLGSQTAEMLEPFENSDNRGIVLTEDDEAAEVLARASDSGISVAMHAIGDKAVWRAISHYRNAAPSGLRHRIEHVQLIHPEDLPKLRDLNLIGSVQPIHLVSDMEIVHQHWGQRGRFAYAFNSLRENGMHLAFGSDCPVESPDVLAGLHAAVYREKDGRVLYAEERLPLRDAILAYTLGGAYASGEEHLKGTIDVGKLADLVVLSEDPFTAPNLKHVAVTRTILGGKTMF